MPTRVFLLLLVGFLAGCCCGPRTRTASYSTVSHLMHSTGMIVTYDDETQRWRVKCSGVWISKHYMLTAHHCVADEQRTDVLARSDYGASMSKVVEAWEAEVVKVDAINDLAIVKVGLPSEHETAALAWYGPTAGDTVHVVGHTMGLPWSYSAGVVGAVRTMPNVDEHDVEVVQVASAASFGNSGGGVYNADGELVGICSFTMQNTQLSFFVHLDVVRSFLDGVALS